MEKLSLRVHTEFNIKCPDEIIDILKVLEFLK